MVILINVTPIVLNSLIIAHLIITTVVSVSGATISVAKLISWVPVSTMIINFFLAVSRLKNRLLL